MEFVTNYINGALEELRHVRWPTRSQAIRLSAIVIGFTFVASAIFGVVDYVLSELVQLLISFV